MQVVVVGGGMAGLAACYYLLKNDPQCFVTLVEKDPSHLGGNIYSRTQKPVAPIDFGVCEVFSWYASVRSLLREVYPVDEDAWANLESFTKFGYGTTETTVPLNGARDNWKQVFLVPHLLKYGQFYTLSAQQPIHNVMSLQTAMDRYLFKTNNSPNKAPFKAFMEGYGYGPSADFYLGVTLSIAYRPMQGSLFHCNTKTMVTRIMNYLQAPTGFGPRFTLVRNGNLMHVDTVAQTLHFDRVEALPFILHCDRAVLAMPCTPFVTTLLSAAASVPLTPIQYTRTWSVLVQFVESRDFYLATMLDTALFPRDSPMRILSFGHMAKCNQAKNSVLMYVRVDQVPASGEQEAVWAFVETHYTRIGALADCTGITLIEMRQFPYTMPYGVTHTDHINAVKRVPITGFLQFAGQWCGFPSLEMACYSGARAAAVLTNRVQAFDAQYHALDKASFQEFWAQKLKEHKQWLGLAILVLVVFLALVGVVIGLACRKPQKRSL